MGSGGLGIHTWMAVVRSRASTEAIRRFAIADLQAAEKKRLVLRQRAAVETNLRTRLGY